MKDCFLGSVRVRSEYCAIACRQVSLQVSWRAERPLINILASPWDLGTQPYHAPNIEFMVRPAMSMLSASQASQSIPHWRLVGQWHGPWQRSPHIMVDLVCSMLWAHSSFHPNVRCGPRVSPWVGPWAGGAHDVTLKALQLPGGLGRGGRTSKAASSPPF